MENQLFFFSWISSRAEAEPKLNYGWFQKGLWRAPLFKRTLNMVPKRDKPMFELPRLKYNPLVRPVNPDLQLTKNLVKPTNPQNIPEPEFESEVDNYDYDNPSEKTLLQDVYGPHSPILGLTKYRITVRPRPIRPLIAKFPKIPKLKIPHRPLPEFLLPKKIKPLKLNVPEIPKLTIPKRPLPKLKLKPIKINVPEIPKLTVKFKKPTPKPIRPLKIKVPEIPKLTIPKRPLPQLRLKPLPEIPKLKLKLPKVTRKPYLTTLPKINPPQHFPTDDFKHPDIPDIKFPSDFGAPAGFGSFNNHHSSPANFKQQYPR